MPFAITDYDCSGIKYAIRESQLILSLQPTNERRRYKLTSSLIGWAQT